MNKFRVKTSNVLKVCFVFVLLTGVTGCRELAVMFAPEKNALTAKKVERGKPNLSETETEELDVDPDSDDLVEETEDEPNPVVDNTNANTAANTNTNTSEANAGKTDSNTEESKTNPSNAAQKAQSLIGKWQTTIDGNVAIFEFGSTTQQGDRYVGKLTVSALIDNEPQPMGEMTYTILSDGSMEVQQNGKSSKVSADVSANNTTMRFTGADGKVVNLTRATGTTPQNQRQNNPSGRATPPPPIGDGQN